MLVSRSDRLELLIRSPDSLSKDESVVVVFVLEKWNETPCLHMGRHICCTIGSTRVLIITLLMCVHYAEASSQRHLSSNKSRYKSRRSLGGYPRLDRPKKSFAMLAQKGHLFILYAYLFTCLL